MGPEHDSRIPRVYWTRLPLSGEFELRVVEGGQTVGRELIGEVSLRACLLPRDAIEYVWPFLKRACKASSLCPHQALKLLVGDQEFVRMVGSPPQPRPAPPPAKREPDLRQEVDAERGWGALLHDLATAMVRSADDRLGKLGGE